MHRNLSSNRQLRAFNSLLVKEFGDDYCYINARMGWPSGNQAMRWIEEDLEHGDKYIFSYAEDKPWFHRCLSIPIYCGIKGGSIEEIFELKDEIIFLIRSWYYKASVKEIPSERIPSQLGFDVEFTFPRWHEEDRDEDILDYSEINLFPELSVSDKEEPYLLGMTETWFNEEADQFFNDAQLEIKQKVSIYEYLHFIGVDGRWERSTVNAMEGSTGCTISFYNANGKLENNAYFLPIGTYSKLSETFLWVWHNLGWLKSYQLTDSLRENNPEVFHKITKVKAINEKYGFEEFAKAEPFEIAEFECWEFTAMACKELQADHAYMTPGEDGNLYGLIFDTDPQQSNLIQKAVSMLRQYRNWMKEFLVNNPHLNEVSSITFAKKFVASELGHILSNDLKLTSNNHTLFELLKLRASDKANEERRFKEVMSLLFSTH